MIIKVDSGEVEEDSFFLRKESIKILKVDIWIDKKIFFKNFGDKILNRFEIKDLWQNDGFPERFFILKDFVLGRLKDIRQLPQDLGDQEFNIFEQRFIKLLDFYCFIRILLWVLA